MSRPPSCSRPYISCQFSREQTWWKTRKRGLINTLKQTVKGQLFSNMEVHRKGSRESSELYPAPYPCLWTLDHQREIFLSIPVTHFFNILEFLSVPSPTWQIRKRKLPSFSIWMPAEDPQVIVIQKYSNYISNNCSWLVFCSSSCLFFFSIFTA